MNFYSQNDTQVPLKHLKPRKKCSLGPSTDVFWYILSNKSLNSETQKGLDSKKFSFT